MLSSSSESLGVSILPYEFLKLSSSSNSSSIKLSSWTRLSFWSLNYLTSSSRCFLESLLMYFLLYTPSICCIFLRSLSEKHYFSSVKNNSKYVIIAISLKVNLLFVIYSILNVLNYRVMDSTSSSNILVSLSTFFLYFSYCSLSAYITTFLSSCLCTSMIERIRLHISLLSLLSRSIYC